MGDPQTRDMTKKDRWGTGGSGKPIGVAEISKNRTAREGRGGDGPRRRSGQGRQPVLRHAGGDAAAGQGHYTVFGRVISGMDIVEKIQAEDRIVRMAIK